MRFRNLYLFLGSVAVLLIGIYLYYSKAEPFKSYSLRFSDSFYSLQDKKPSKDIVFIAVDEPSVNMFGRWPWNRDIIAKGLDQLVESDVVLMDMIFSEETNSFSDQKLASSLSSLPASVCGFFLRKKATQNISVYQEEMLVDSALDRLLSQKSEHNDKQIFAEAKYTEMNIEPILEACSMSGAFSTIRDSDQLLRSYPVAYFIEESNSAEKRELLYPSLAVQALRLKLNADVERVSDTQVKIDKYLLDLDEKGFVKLNFYKRGDYNQISFADVITKRYDKNYFKNKIVILGITDIGAGDMRATPIGELPGPLLHYTFLSNVLNGHLLVERSDLNIVAIAFFAFLPFVLLLVFKPLFIRAVVYFISYLGFYYLIEHLFIDKYILIDGFLPLLSLILSVLILEGLEFIYQEKNSKFIKGAFSNYLSKDLLNQLVKDPDALKLGGDKKELSILFSDIRGFTTISEKLEPDELIRLLNRYFTPMTDAVLDNYGMLDKYIGDAVMAFFNAPINVKDHADASCRSALVMIDALNKLNIELKVDGIDPIYIGIGINTAEVIVGNMGSKNRFNYTIVGDGVNLASRVEGLTKNYGVNILITEFTKNALNSTFLVREVEQVVVKGKAEAVLLYELLENTKENKKIVKSFTEALNVYKNGDLKNALYLFNVLVDEYNDSVSSYFITLINDGKKYGIHTMKTK